MQPMSLDQAKTIQGGAISGALLTGIAAIIEGFNTLMTNIGGMTFAFQNQHQIKGEVQFNKTFSLGWDNTKAPQSQIVNNKWIASPAASSPTSTPIWNFQ